MPKVPVLMSDEVQEDRPMPSRNHGRVAQNLGVALGDLRDAVLGIELPLEAVFL
jgi:hypothetical protein